MATFNKLPVHQSVSVLWSIGQLLFLGVFTAVSKIFPKLILIIAMASLVFATVHDSRASSVESTFHPNVFVAQSYTDNFNLSNDPTRVWSTAFTGSSRWLTNSEYWNTELKGNYHGARYFDKPELDKDEGFADIAAGYLTEYGIWELNGRYSVDQPSSSQLEAGSQVFDRVTRTNWRIGPAWSYRFSEKETLQLNYQYSQTAYSDDEQSPRSDFFSHFALVGLNHALSETSSISTQASYSRFVNDGLSFESDQFVLQTGIDHAFSDSFDVSLAGGGILLLSKFVTQRCIVFFQSTCLAIVGEEDRSSQTGYVLNFSANKRFEYSDLSGTFSHNLSPTVDGGQVQRRELEIKLRQRLTEVLTATFAARASETETLESTLSESGRLNYSGDANLEWQLSRGWYLIGRYRYDRQKRENDREASERNTLSLSIRYQWQPFALTR